MAARSTAGTLGIALASTDSPASSPSNANAAACQAEGTLSMRQGADAFDQLREFGIGRGFITKEPAPELIVLDFQKT